MRWDADSGILGQSWNMAVTKDGTSIGSGTRVTNLRGEAEFRLRNIVNGPGTETFAGTATDPATGESCAGRIGA